MKKRRLDQLVFDKGLVSSRERAKTSIMAGNVFVNGQRVDKPGTSVSEDAEIELRGSALAYVSRGGLKLEKAIKVFGFNPSGRVCIDCGASTGGFTDVLLQNGAKKVYAVDVGYGQLAWSLRTDERVVVMERTNIRSVTPDMLDDEPSLAVMDLSFISLRLVLPVVRDLLADSGDVICLIKPQFEAGRENVGKKGVVREKSTHIDVINDFIQYSHEAGFTLFNLNYSPVRGPEGNIEYLALLKKGIFPPPTLPDVKALVEESHNELDV